MMQVAFFLIFCVVPVVLATTEPTVTEQMHLAQGSTPTEMMAMWVTNTTTVESADCEYFATNSEDGLKHVQKARGSSQSYKFHFRPSEDEDASTPTDVTDREMRGKKTEYTSGQLHHALLDGLKAGTEYTYSCGGSEERTFKTLPAVGDKHEIVFGVIGDLGTTKDSEKTLEHCESNAMDMMLHAGDLSYANCDEKIWDEYGRMVESLASTLPWMVSAGNHEIELPSLNSNGSDAFAAFEARYQMPAVKPAEFGKVVIPPSGECTPSVFQSEYNYGNSFYSFESGMAHVTVLNCYSVSDKDSAQYSFAETDLSGVDRDVTPWLIVIMHCPWYNSNKAHVNEEQTVDMKNNLEGMFYKYGVNIAFQGHVHAYERSYPVFNGLKDDNGPVYVTIGDGGNKEGHAWKYSEPAPEWSAFRNGMHYGHGTFTLHNTTTATWSWNRNNDGVQVVADSAIITNPRG